MIGHLIINGALIIGCLHIAGVTAVISVFAMVASALDANLAFDGGGHVPQIEVKSPNSDFIRREVVQHVPVLLLMIHDLVEVIVVAGFAEVMLFAFANHSTERVLDQTVILKHAGELRHFLFYDHLLELDTGCADRNGKIETILRCVTLLCNERCDQVSKRFAGADFRFADGDLFSGEPKVHVLAEFDLILTNGESILGKDRAEDGFNRFQRIVDDYIQIPLVAGVFDGVKHHRRHAVISAGIEEIVFSSAGNLGAVSRHAVQGDIPCGVFDKEMIDDKPSLKGEVVNGSVVGFIRIYEVLQRIAVVICDFKHVEDPPSLGVFGSRMVCRSVTAPAQ